MPLSCCALSSPCGMNAARLHFMCHLLMWFSEAWRTNLVVAYGASQQRDDFSTVLAAHERGSDARHLFCIATQRSKIDAFHEPIRFRSIVLAQRTRFKSRVKEAQVPALLRSPEETDDKSTAQGQSGGNTSKQNSTG